MMNLGLLSLVAAASIGIGAPVIREGEDPISEPEISETAPEEEHVEEEKADARITAAVYHKDETSGEIVVDENRKYGDILLSAEEGKEGDVVVALVQANPTMDVQGKSVTLYRYVIQSVQFNGEPIAAANEKGEYNLELVAGDNTLAVTFCGRAEISVANLAETNWKALLTADNLIKLITLAVLLFVSSGFFISLLRGRKIKSITSEEFAAKGKEAIEKAEKEFLENTVKPLLEAQGEENKETVDTVKTLLRVTLLAQENTPEARSEIIKELQQAKNTDQELAAKIQGIVDQSIKDRDAKAEERKKALETAKESIKELKPIETKKEYDGTSI